MPGIHTPSELSEAERAVVEKLLGRPLEDDEAFDIQAFRPHGSPQGAERQAAWSRLNAVMDEMAERAQGLTDEELDHSLEQGPATDLIDPSK